MSDADNNLTNQIHRLMTTRPSLAANLAIRAFILVWVCVWDGGISAFVYGGLRGLGRDLHRHYFYQPIEATAVAVTTKPHDRTEISYSYQVEGHEYRASADGEGGFKIPFFTRPTTMPIESGQKFTVFYDPANPGQSAVSNSVNMGTMVLASFLWPFVFIGLVMPLAVVTPLRAVQNRRGLSLLMLLGSMFGKVGFLGIAGCGVIIALAFLTKGDAPGLGLLVLAAVPVVAYLLARRSRDKYLARLAAAERAAALGGQAAVEAAASSPAGIDLASFAGRVNTGRAKSQAIGLAVFAVIWLAFVSPFLGLLGSELLSQLDAQRRFVAARGRILTSQVREESSGDSVSYKPSIEYEYYVGDLRLTGSRVSYSQFTSTVSFATHYVKEFPAGREVTVYHDPDRAQEAVLLTGIDEQSLWPALFLQPFLAVGLIMLGAAVHIFRTERAAARYFAGAYDGRDVMIPTWGPLRRNRRGFTIIRRRSVVLRAVTGFIAGFAVSCLVCTIISSAAAVNWSPLRAAFFSLAPGVLVAFLAARRGIAAEINVDLAGDELSVRGPRRDQRMAVSGIESWIVRMIPDPHLVRQEGAPTEAPLLAARAGDGREMAVHVFKADSMATQIAMKAAAILSQLTGRQARFVEDGTAASAGDTPAEGRGRAWQSAHARKYRDLT
ncbi:MAG: DUF3592 domain-containing protein [Phycisphaerae bacterium]